MAIYGILKKHIRNIWDFMEVRFKRYVEVKKFKDPRRVKIFSNVLLSQEQKAAIDSLYQNNYGSKIPYTWHRHFTAFTGNFDVKYFPELLYIPEFEHFMNPDRAYTKALSDKNLLPIIAQSLGIRTPELVAARINGVYHDGKYHIISEAEFFHLLENVGEIFIKPSVNSSSGNGCFLLNIQDSVDKKEGNIKQIVQKLGDNFCIQRPIQMHPSISEIYPNSVNTFRIITYYWKDKVYAMPVIMRMGRGGNYLDNAHAGGMFIAVDNDGTLHEKAFTEFREEYTEHPDTHLKFDGYKIAGGGVLQSIRAAVTMHEAISQIGVVNWDFTIDKDNKPVLIEGNMNSGSVWLIEMAHGKGPFGDQTEEILQWIHSMKKKAKSDRK